MFSKLRDLYTRRTVLQSILMITFWSLSNSSILSGLTLFFAVTLHELGHAIAMIWFNIPIKELRYEIVFAYVKPEVTIPRGLRRFFVYLAGPAIGSIFGFVTLGLYLVTRTPEFLDAAKLGFSLNLLNLLPIFPLDGGQILLNYTSSLGKKAVIFQFVVTCLVLAGLFVVQESTSLRIFIAIGFILNAAFVYLRKDPLVDLISEDDEPIAPTIAIDEANPGEYALLYALTLILLGVFVLYTNRIPV